MYVNYGQSRDAIASIVCISAMYEVTLLVVFLHVIVKENDM